MTEITFPVRKVDFRHAILLVKRHFILFYAPDEKIGNLLS
ncbi:hypothetical protein DDI_2649 [Dickeya dianthicola RNS04.9]|nr:hypothetical protein DDI_2649 [Dickeya dianthicola RNS04.9]